MKRKISVSLFLALLLLLSAGATASADKADEISEYFHKSFTYESRKDYDAALRNVLKILQIDPGDYTAVLRAGWLNYLNGSYQNSLIYYRKALSLAPHAIEPRLGLTLPMMALKRWRDTEVQAWKILKIDPKNYYATSRLAFSLFSQGRYRDAERYYRRLITLYPSDIEMKLGLGWTLLRMGRKKSAEKYFAEVLRVRRANASARAGMETLRRGNP